MSQQKNESLLAALVKQQDKSSLWDVVPSIDMHMSFEHADLKDWAGLGVLELNSYETDDDPEDNVTYLRCKLVDAWPMPLKTAKRMNMDLYGQLPKDKSMHVDDALDTGLNNLAKCISHDF